jgi:predicted DNA-binding protein
MESKITVKIPEALRRRAKAVAALRGETVSAVVREALATYVTEAMEEVDDVRALDDVEARLAAGAERLHDHDEVWRDLDRPKADA